MAIIVGKKTSGHLGSKPKGAYESDIGKKTANPTEVNQIWRTSGKLNVHGASCEPPYEPAGAEENQTWRTSEQSNVRGVCLGNPRMNQLVPSAL